MRVRKPDIVGVLAVPTNEAPAKPDLIYTPGDDYLAHWPTRVSCPHCHEGHPDTLIQNGPPALDIRRGIFVRWRGLTCRDCGRVWRWLQQCDQWGMPLPCCITCQLVRK